MTAAPGDAMFGDASWAGAPAGTGAAGRVDGEGIAGRAGPSRSGGARPVPEVPMPDHLPDRPSVLDRLQSRFDAIATRRDKDGDSSGAHVAILDRLSANRRSAEGGGWTACALERDGGLGRLRLLGVAPGESTRREVPDHG